MRDKYNIKVLIETGTFHGRSSAWAADFFDAVYTIEVREDWYYRAQQFHKTKKNLKFWLGDSKTKLPEIIADIYEPAIYWLDAHNAGQIFGNTPDDCPILFELEAIFQRQQKDIILIDDACCFVPPLPYDESIWPELWQIKALAANAGYLSVVAHDVIVLMPADSFDDLAWFCAQVSGGEGRASVEAIVLKAIA
jgi:hypothetical protein